MPHPEKSPVNRAAVLRGAGFATAVVLGAVAVWLIVTGTTQKRIEIGVLTGLWGLLLGSYSVFGSRRAMGTNASDTAPRPRPGLDRSGFDQAGFDQAAFDRASYDRAVLDRAGLDRADDADAGAALAVRAGGEVERAAEVAARRAWEKSLEDMLRREIREAMQQEVSELRSEIGQLRRELVDKVGGQLRLERIETTRLIGSDLEALQHEVRQLKVASETGSLPELTVERADGETRVTSTRKFVREAARRPAPEPVVEADADVVDADEPVVDDATVDEPVVDDATVDEPVVDDATVDEPVVEEPVAEELAVEEPAVEEPVAEEPAVEEPVAEEPAVEEPIAEEPAVEEPAPAAATVDASPGPDVTPMDQTAPLRPIRISRREDRAATLRPTAQPEPTTQPVEEATPEPVTEATPGSTFFREDPFADLPRISKFTDFDLDPAEAAVAPSRHSHAAQSPASPSPAATPDRRSRHGAAAETVDRTAADQTASDQTAADQAASDQAASDQAASADETPRGRRHRRAEENEGGEDLLAKLLAREGARR